MNNPSFSVANRRAFHRAQPLIGLAFLAVTLVHSLLAQPQGRKKPDALPTRPGAILPLPKTGEEESPNDPAIVVESQRLAKQRAAQQQKLEQELLLRNTPAQTWSRELWHGFRQTFPFHAQVLALSEAEADGSRTLIVSEPPPHVTLGNILVEVGGEALLGHQIKSTPVGYDGWVKDVVLAIKVNDLDLQSLLSRLHQRLFFTSYKSYTLPLPTKVRATSYNLDLTVTTEEIKRWILDESEVFTPVEGGKAETFTSMTAERSSGVYLSHRRGLVGWWIPKKRTLYDCRVEARQFALDSDLIVGAIAQAAGMLVVGRERLVPVDLLPPLRVETLVLLADVQRGTTGALAQSYERTRPFAGRIDKSKDWAPILLSPELRDTEYGSLLNITDQLLKGWSNNGETKYINFNQYPRPNRWPFAKSLPVLLQAPHLTYNWNTKGAGYVVNYGATNILALNRCGALPVSYIPEGQETRAAAQTVKAEDTAYNYFAGLGDPNLVRVVQYAAMYQIFSAFDIARSSHSLASDNYPDKLINSLTAELLGEVRRSSEDELEKLAQQIATATLDWTQINARLDQQDKEDIEKAPKEIEKLLREKGHPPGDKQYDVLYQRVMTGFLQKLQEDRKNSTTKLIQTRTGEIKKQLQQIKTETPPQDDRASAIRQTTLSHLAEIRQLPERYAKAVAARSNSWVHTPVVVISFNDDSRSVGGHNLNARAVKIVPDATLPVGQVSIDRAGNLTVNPRDIARARSFARQVERSDWIRQVATALRVPDPQTRNVQLNQVLDSLQNALRTSEIPAIRPRETALQITTPPPPKPPRKPPVSTGEPPAAGGSGWGGENFKALPIPPERRDANAIRFKVLANGRNNLEYGTNEAQKVVLAREMVHEDAVDAAVRQALRRAERGEPVVIEFEGMPEHKARATLRTMEAKMEGQAQGVELIGLLSGKETSVTLEALVSRYDFATARVEASEIQTLRTGELRQEISLKVAALDRSGKTASFTSEVIFKGATPLSVIAAVKARIMRAYQGLAKRWSQLAQSRRDRATLRAYNRELARAVKKIKQRTNLDFDVKTQFDFDFLNQDRNGTRDVYISENSHDHSGAASLAAPGTTE